MTSLRSLAFINARQKQLKFIMLLAAITVFVVGVLLFVLNSIFPGFPVSDRFIPQTILSAVTPALSVLLVYELFVLIMSVQGPLIPFVRHLFEIVSLIVLRDLFKSLDQLATNPTNALYIEFAAIAVGSLLIYFLVEVLERTEKNFVDSDMKSKDLPKETRRSVLAKDILEAMLLIGFLLLSLYEAGAWIIGIDGTGFNTAFLNIVFTGIIFFNLMLLFISLFQTDRYETLFEYSALVLAAAIVLVALPKEPLVYIPLIVGALLFVIITLSLHGFARGQTLGGVLRTIKNR